MRVFSSNIRGDVSEESNLPIHYLNSGQYALCLELLTDTPLEMYSRERFLSWLFQNNEAYGHLFLSNSLIQHLREKAAKVLKKDISYIISEDYMEMYGLNSYTKFGSYVGTQIKNYNLESLTEALINDRIITFDYDVLYTILHRLPSFQSSITMDIGVLKNEIFYQKEAALEKLYEEFGDEESFPEESFIRVS